MPKALTLSLALAGIFTLTMLLLFAALGLALRSQRNLPDVQRAE